MALPYRKFHLFNILQSFEEQKLPLDLFLSNYFRSHKALGSKDRKEIAETIFGLIRWKGLLDYLLPSHISWEKRHELFEKIQPVGIVEKQNLPSHVKVSLPADLFRLLEKQYGLAQALELGKICNSAAPITIRINPAKTTRENLLSRWESQGALPGQYAPFAIHFSQRHPLFSWPEFKEGLFEVQDEGSQLLAQLVEAQPGQKILDYCAGSGGKTLAFAHRLEGKGTVFLHDIRPIALQQARLRLKRAGIQNAQFLPPEHTTLKTLKKKIDWVLVDAPCSGTGTLRRNPDMKEKFSTALLDRLISEQRVIFEKALSYLKPGGKLIYATCSILAEENESQVQHFLQTYPIQLVGDVFKTLPLEGGMDGFFAATFIRNN